MQKRRKFVKGIGLGLAGMTFLAMSKPSVAVPNKGVVKGPEDGETYFVREGTPITIRISKTDGINSTSICTEEILPGGFIPVHKHLHEDETFLILDGKGTFILDGQEIPISKGSTAFVPRDTWHALKNTSSDPLVFCFGFTPSGFEDFFRKIGTLKGTPFKAKSADEVKALALQYGMVYP